MLNPSKLLMLDEATAALDLDTDAAVQRVLRKNFADRTTVTIAHRLDTVIDSDKILVMDAGKVAEFDSPHNFYGYPQLLDHGMASSVVRDCL
jgi:ATP-binding cassette subfamily C (CFTR/MRP) protein 1